MKTYEWKDPANTGSGERTVIYTAIFGRKDRLRDPLVRSTNARHVCFTDDPHLQSDVWEIIHAQPTDPDPCRSAKWYKICADEHFDCQQSVWVDANLEINSDLSVVFEQFQARLALFLHDARYCAFDEARECQSRGLDSPDRIGISVEQLRQSGHPPRWGLFKGGMIFRRHTEQVTRFNERWWSDICRGSRRDQVTLPNVIRELGISCAAFPADYLLRLVNYRPHSRKTAPLAQHPTFSGVLS